MPMSPLLPRTPVPALDLPRVGGGRFILGESPASAFDLIVFYRGLHCPICLKYLKELAQVVPEFHAIGVDVVAVSGDTEERAREMARKVDSQGLRFAWGLGMRTAREWGLYISTSRGKTSIGIEEPALFAEPGLFLVRPNGSLFYGAVQTMPFARPPFRDLLASVGWALDHDYPARGEYTGELPEEVLAGVE